MEKIVEKIIQNARNTNEVVQKLSGKLRNQALLWEYFHLRPTSSGVTIVSHHPCAPMRGIVAHKPKELEESLLRLYDGLVESTMNEEKLLQILDSCGFKRRGKRTKKSLEEGVQAAFISGMVSGDSEYEGIHFLASELILRNPALEQQNKFDVVGYKNGTLYIFELKRDYTPSSVFSQVDRYRGDVENRLQTYMEVLAAYPRTVCPEEVKINDVKYIAVMKDSHLSKVDWQEKTGSTCTDTWLFRPALAFRKLRA